VYPSVSHRLAVLRTSSKSTIVWITDEIGLDVVVVSLWGFNGCSKDYSKKSVRRHAVCAVQCAKEVANAHTLTTILAIFCWHCGTCMAKDKAKNARPQDGHGFDGGGIGDAGESSGSATSGV